MKDHDHEWEAVTDPTHLGVGAVVGYRCTRCQLISRFKPGSRTVVIGGARLENVHPLADCEGKPCTIDNPSDHHMRAWPLVWRFDRRIFERICPHGIGHPDPDGINPDTVHGCDMCCVDPAFGSGGA